MPDELYSLSADAKNDLRNIYRFGYERFGETQADSYVDELLMHLITLGLHPFMSPVVGELYKQPRRSVFRSHAIYYDYVPAGPIEVRRILGAQDPASAF